MGSSGSRQANRYPARGRSFRQSSPSTGRNDPAGNSLNAWNQSTRDLAFAKCTDVTCGNAILRTLDDAGDVGRWTKGSDLLPVVSYRDQSNSRLKVARCVDISCSTVTRHTINPFDTGGSSTSLAIGADGFPLVIDQAAGIARVTHCDDVACERSLSNSVAESVNGVQDLALTIGVDGLPILAIQDFRNSQATLLVAHCSNPACF